MRKRSVKIADKLSGGRCDQRNRFERRRLLPQLQPIERGISATFAQQFIVPAGFDDQAVLDNENAIGMHDRRQPMGDGDGGAPFAELGKGFLHVALGLRIQRSRRFVK